MNETEFFGDFTFTEFVNKYFKILIVLCNSTQNKREFRKIVKKIISFQTDITKQNLFDTYKKTTERQVVDFLTKSVELYRIKKS